MQSCASASHAFTCGGFGGDAAGNDHDIRTSSYETRNGRDCEVHALAELEAAAAEGVAAVVKHFVL